jgi:hypothetical protein
MNRETRRTIYRYQPFFLPLGIIVGVICIFFFLIVPSTQYTISMFQQVNEAQEQVSSLQQKLAVLETQDEQRLDSLLIAAVSAISVDKALPGILRTVETIANESNLIIDAVSFDGSNTLATEAAKTFTDDDRQFGSYRIPFTVTTSSGFEELRTFLEKTVQVRRFVRARSFNLNFGADDEVSTQIMFDAFYLPLQAGNATRQVIALSSQEQRLLDSIQVMADASNLTIAEDSIDQPLETGSLRNPFQ